MRQTPSEIAFRFHYVRNNYAVGIIPTKGLASDREIMLGQETLSYDDIAFTQFRGERLFMTLTPTANPVGKIAQNIGDGSHLVLQIYWSAASALQRFINEIASRKQCERQRREAIQNQQANFFHTLTCPECRSTIGLYGFGRTAAIYCPYCENLFKDNLQLLSLGWKYACCDLCQMFDRVGNQVEHYVSPVHFTTVRYYHICDNCAKERFIKTLLGNLFYVLLLAGLLGWLSAIFTQFLRALIRRDPKLKELAKGNAFLKKGYWEQAKSIYDRLYESYPEHPGLLMNEGIAAWRNNDDVSARDYFQRARRACPNYSPTLGWIQQLESGTAVVTGSRGDDLRFDLHLAFREAISGADKDILFLHWEICEDCCGRKPTCRTCNGSSRLQRRKKLRVSVPAGVEEKTRLRIAGEGDAGVGGGEAGDLYVYLQIDRDPDLQREGLNLFSSVQISPEQARMGCQIAVKTVDGSEILTIPAGTQPETVLRLPELGVPQLGQPARRGDHFITVKIGS